MKKRIEPTRCPSCGSIKVKPACMGRVASLRRSLARRDAICASCGERFSPRQLSLFVAARP